MVTPVLNELADEMSDQIVIGDHDIDNSPNAYKVWCKRRSNDASF